MTDRALPYQPPRWLRNRHLMTFAAWARPRRYPHLPRAVRRLFQVDADSRVRADCYWQPGHRSRPTLVALHGLEGSSEAHYILGLAEKAFAIGWNAVALNQRNCGGTEHLTPKFYHSGLTADPLAVLRELRSVDGIAPVALVGYSLGGNLALKLAGELGEAAADLVAAVVAVSPTADLPTCMAAMERRENRVYEWNFMRNLRSRVRRKCRCWPGHFDTAPLRRLETIRAFDAAYTAPHHGFASAEDYYYRASAMRVIERVQVPTLIISAADDPFVPPEQFLEPAVAGNPAIVCEIVPYGGHCAFLAAGARGNEAYWAERRALDFAAAVLGEAASGDEVSVPRATRRETSRQTLGPVPGLRA